LDKHFINSVDNYTQFGKDSFDLSKRFIKEINAKHIHFIGIGGSGMFPLVQILHDNGFYITGSDNNATETTQTLLDMGITVFLRQEPENIGNADLVIYTAAVSETNPELSAARASGVRLLERSELLGLLTAFYDNTICVSGTHGKTTVTSMITQIFFDAGRDPSAVIGGKLKAIGGSGRSGGSNTFIVESCEFRDHFLKLSPDIAVILNIDEDHMDYFKTLDRLVGSFTRFADSASKVIIYNGDDKNTVFSTKNVTKNKLTFGYDSENNYYPCNIQNVNPLLTIFDVYKDKSLLCTIKLQVPGKHNILNAVAAATVSDFCKIKPDEISKGLENFHGAGRRFEKYGEAGGITVVDDYAHHPAEIAVTLDAALSMKSMGFSRVIAVHQPFTFSRTKTLLSDFASVLSKADITVLTSIMGGREENIYDIHTSDLAKLIPGAYFFEEEEHDANFNLVCDCLCDIARPGDLIITLGCGDVNKVARKLVTMLQEKYENAGGVK
jgi:UDP-N-acetylmuramate--alanine ligase